MSQTLSDLGELRLRVSWRDLGFRAAAVNLSDLAASGAVADGLLVSLGLPLDTAVASVIELYEGIAETGADVIGGDTTAGRHDRCGRRLPLGDGPRTLGARSGPSRGHSR
jgi:thiamine monophosphate kinase